MPRVGRIHFQKFHQQMPRVRLSRCKVNHVTTFIHQPQYESWLFEQFTILREKSPLITDGIKIKRVMDRQARNTLTAAQLVHPARVSTATDAIPESTSSPLSPFKSPASSHSSAESETTWSDESRTTAPSASDRLGTPPRDQTQITPEQGESSLDATTAPQKSRKRHRKSHGGCFNCKRRKIKVLIELKPSHV
jgi:hypothetical protein